MNIGAILQEARDKASMIAVQRPRSDQIAGFVLSMTETLVLIQEWRSDVRLDGFHVLPITSLSALEVPYCHQDFAKRVQTKRGEGRAEIDVDLTDWKTVIESTRVRFPIGRYEYCNHDSDFLTERACGRVITIDDDIVAVRAISDDAIWEKGQAFLGLATLKRYSFGSEHEKYLAEFAREHTPVGPRLPTTATPATENGGDAP